MRCLTDGRVTDSRAQVCELDLYADMLQGKRTQLTSDLVPAASSTSRRRTRLVGTKIFAHRFTDGVIQILDELIIAGELQESSKKSVLRVVRSFYFVLLASAISSAMPQVTQADSIEEQENSEDTMARLGSLGSRGP